MPQSWPNVVKLLAVLVGVSSCSSQLANQQECFDWVKLGMARQRVESCYGGPPYRIFLEYPSGEAQFGGGKFTNAFGPHGTLPPPQWALTIGMSIPEVIAVLGKPARWVDANYVVGQNSNFFWFVDDKLIEKKRMPLSPVQ